MKKSVVIMVLLSFLVTFSYGCASKSYVKEQNDALADRINKLEASSASNKADAEKAKADAAKALQTAQDCASKSENDAQRAEAAAKRAEAAAKKAEKAFELHQRK